MKHLDFDVVVVGGGHAGTEAALASARMGVRTALITLKKADIGVMSCNPAFGGLGKGHLVREIDALDGMMGVAADLAGIQFRLLNRRKGPAVQGPRLQADRQLYKQAANAIVSSAALLTIVEAEVTDFAVGNHRVHGVTLSDGSEISCNSVILTAGTFLRGVIHIGTKTQGAGRMGDSASEKLADRFRNYDLARGRLKTGTPPRLDGKTINWDVLTMQPGDDDPTMLSFLSDTPTARQLSCGMTSTNVKTHDVIRTNLSKSALFGGQIDGVGPRYCPSIEDKISRFADRDSHQIFLEPEGVNTDWVYPNGISTSLPLDVQVKYVQTIQGLENAEIVQPGYAIEYDYFDPRSLDSGLELRAIKGLFLAGQINGTTGYEEAGAQGLVAGLNAARIALGQDKVHFSRDTSYIGVMIDDLTTRGVTEPYRMFTSRAEFRLSLRADNADQRLTPMGVELGCISEKRAKFFGRKVEKLDAVRNELKSMMVTPGQAADAGIAISDDGTRRSGYQILSFPNVVFDQIARLNPKLEATSQNTREQIEKEALYANYLVRQKNDVAALRRDEAFVIPTDFEFSCLKGLSAELLAKLELARPETLGQAGRIEGMTPAALTLLLARIRKPGKRSA